MACDNSPSPATAKDAALKSLILRESPHLRDALAAGDNHRAARLILRWVSPRIAWASGNDTPVNTSRMSAGRIYVNLFRNHLRGVYCGGAADFFQKTLALFGVPSVVVDFGDKQVFTHVTVLVPSGHRERLSSYSVFDPTFNLEIVARHNRSDLGFMRALALGARRPGAVAARTGSLSRRALVDTVGRYTDQSCRRTREAPCGVRWLSRDPRLARNNYADGVAGLLRLYADGQIFSTRPHLPQLINAHAAKRKAWITASRA
jgi:hypothetical protein